MISDILVSSRLFDTLYWLYMWESFFGEFFLSNEFNKVIWIAETAHQLHKVHRIDINRSYSLCERFFDDTINEVERGLTYQEKYHMDVGWVYVRLNNIPLGTKIVIVNNKSIRIKKVIQELNPLFEVINTGNNINKSLSLINASHLIGYVIEKQLPLSEALPNIIDMVYGDNAKDLVDAKLYKAVKIDLFSLKNYITKTKEYYLTLDYNHSNRNKTISCIDKANKIYAIASGFLGFMPHFESTSNTSSRTYYKYMNLQNCPKDVRLASLGNCVSIDIENSVYSWKLNVGNEYGLETRYTCDYVEHKKSIRKRINDLVYGELNKSGKFPFKSSIKRIKGALTALSFGARCDAKHVQHSFRKDTDKKPTNTYKKKESALRKIFNKNQFKLFASNEYIINLVNEQKIIDTEIFNRNKHLFAGDINVMKGGRISRNSVVSSMYQTYEKNIMDYALEGFEDRVILNVHDGVYMRDLLVDDVKTIRTRFHEYKLKIDVERVRAVKLINEPTENDTFVSDHKEFIRQEELKASEYINQHSEKLNRPHNPTTEIDSVIERIENNEYGYNQHLLPELKEQRDGMFIKDMMSHINKQS